MKDIRSVDFLTIKTTCEIWVNMKDVGSGMDVKNLSDLVLKEIYGIYETRNPTKKQVNEYKMAKIKIYKTFTNLSEKELNTKNNKEAYLRNDVMTTITKRCRVEKTRGIRAIDGFRNKLMIPDSEIPKCPEVKSKIGKIFKNQNSFEEYSANIYEIDSYFYKHYKKIISKRKPNKIWVDQGGEFYNNTFKDFLKINNIEMYSTYNEGKSVVAERFIRTLNDSYFKKCLF